MVKINPESLLLPPKVKVKLIDGTQKYKITWDPVEGATGYYVFAGFEPYYIRSLISPKINTTEYIFKPKIFIQYDVVIYFWVAYEKNNQLHFIDDFGSNYMLTKGFELYENDLYTDTTFNLIEYEAQWYFEEIRRRAKAVLEDTGEEVILFKRQITGNVDNYGFKDNDLYGFSLDPNVQSQYRTEETYGTGYFPGFFPGIKVNMRFGQAPNYSFEFSKTGITPLMTYNDCWTLWEPYIRKWDLIFRPLNGTFYLVKENGISNIRGVNIIQRMNNELVNPTDPLCKVNHEDLIEKWSNINKLEYYRMSFGMLPQEGVNNYLLFVFN